MTTKRKTTETKNRGGRPRVPVPSVLLNFKADPKTVAAVNRLEAALVAEGMLTGGRSLAIRRAVLEAAARLDGKGADPLAPVTAALAAKASTRTRRQPRGSK